MRLELQRALRAARSLEIAVAALVVVGGGSCVRVDERLNYKSAFGERQRSKLQKARRWKKRDFDLQIMQIQIVEIAVGRLANCHHTNFCLPPNDERRLTRPPLGSQRLTLPRSSAPAT